MRGLVRNLTPSLRRLAPVLAVGALAACGDGQRVAGPGLDARPAAPAGVIQAFDCVGSTSGGVSCRPSSGGGAGGPSRVIYGGQNVYVKLTSSNVSYDTLTEIYQFDVTVQNLLNEAAGTPDGVTADPDGIRVFFHSGPTVTGGTGVASVANADGTDTFTASNQPYFAYHEILAKNDVSAAKTWQLSIPRTATAFAFTLYVETDLQYLLVINEVLVNPGGTILDSNGEWFELYNAGTFSVDLQNLVIADSAASGRRPYHLISSSVTVPSGGYAVLGNSTNTAINGGATVDYAYGVALALANSLDAIKISRVYGTDTLTLDRTAYQVASTSAQNGISRELKNPSLDNINMDGSNWADAATTAVFGAGGRGTPKAQNSSFVP